MEPLQRMRMNTKNVAGEEMKHRLSPKDKEFRASFEACNYPPAEFNHRAHLRLAYVYLTEHDTETSARMMRDALKRFLEHNRIDVSKYHETLTRAWVMAVRHFMERTAASESADSFIEQNPAMLDSKIMMTHYSAGLIFSDEARARFLEPDRDPIPRYRG
jgi:hypothetical protein